MPKDPPETFKVTLLFSHIRESELVTRLALVELIFKTKFNVTILSHPAALAPTSVKTAVLLLDV